MANNNSKKTNHNNAKRNNTRSQKTRNNERNLEKFRSDLAVRAEGAVQATKGAVQAVKGVKDIRQGNIVTGVKRLAGGTVEFVTGVGKVIFNHPDWYKVDGKLMTPALNTLRPFNPDAVAYLTKDSLSPGLGVSHIVHNYIKVSDIGEAYGFDLAAVRSFQNIRDNLRSNLPYQLESYKQYMRIAFSIAIKAAFIQRTIGWYNAYQTDIPELRDAVHNVTSSIDEKGKVNSKMIKILENYSETILAYTSYKQLLEQISVPSKFWEYATWLVGSVYTDQSLPNKQLYFNIPRSVPMFAIEGNITNAMNFDLDLAYIDPTDLTMDMAIKEVEGFLASYPVLEADIGKSLSGFNPIRLPDMSGTSLNYKQVAAYDEGMFSWIINSYTHTAEELYSATAKPAPDYCRVDFMHAVNDENTVGIVNGVAKFFNIDFIASIEKQACYLAAAGMDFSAASSGNATTNKTVTTRRALPDGSRGYFLQYGSLDEVINILEVVSSNEEVIQYFTADRRNEGGISGSAIQSVKVMLKSGASWSAFGSDAQHDILLATNATGVTKLMLRITQIGNNPVTFRPQLIVVYNNDVVVDILPGDMVDQFEIKRTVDNGSGLVRNKVTLKTGAPFEVTIDSTNANWTPIRNAIGALSNNNSFWYHGLQSLGLGYSLSDASVAYSLTDANMAHVFTNLVEYHIPVRHIHTLTMNTQAVSGPVISWVAGDTWTKETYTPAVVYRDDITAVIQQAMYGLCLR